MWSALTCVDKASRRCRRMRPGMLSRPSARQQATSSRSGATWATTASRWRVMTGARWSRSARPWTTRTPSSGSSSWMACRSSSTLNASMKRSCGPGGTGGFLGQTDKPAEAFISADPGRWYQTPPAAEMGEENQCCSSRPKTTSASMAARKRSGGRGRPANCAAARSIPGITRPSKLRTNSLRLCSNFSVHPAVISPGDQLHRDR